MKRNYFLLILLVAILCFKQYSHAQSHDFVVAPDGAWTWYNDERAAFKNDRLYTSYVKKNGKVALSVNNIKTGANIGSEVILSTWTQKDDHNNAAILMRQDGKIMAFYSPHIREKENYYRTSLVDQPTNQTNWSTEVTQSTTNDSDNKGATYNNAFQLSAEGGKIYNFMRTNNFNPNVKEYSANGTPLSNGKDFILFKNGNGSVRPYVKYTSNNVDRIDFFFTDGHPRNADNSLYHCYYQTNANGSRGNIYQTDGTLITTLQSVFNGTPIDVSQVNKLYVFGSDGTNARAWTHNINYDANGRPVVTYSKQININNITYHYAHWTGTQWVNNFVSDAGRGLYNGEDDYTGIITTNPYNTNEIFMSSNRNPITGVEGNRYEIYSAITADGGSTWNWTAITANSPKDNLRPFVPKGITTPEDRVVLWFYGDYITYFDYTTAVVGEYINRDGGSTPPPPPPGPVLGTYNIDINTATSATQTGYTALQGITGASVTEQGVVFSLFGSGGIDSRVRTGAANDVISDFAFINPEAADATLGVQVTGLPSGRYRFQSYHYDDSFPAPVTVSIREENGTNINSTTNNNDTSPTTFEINVVAGTTYEIVAQENSTANRVRFNGLVVTKLEDANNPVVSFANPLNGATFDAGASIGVTVNATDTDGSIANVQLLLNGSLVRQENFTPYEWGADSNQNDVALNTLAAGTYTLEAIATDNQGNTTTESISITVNSGTPPIANCDTAPSGLVVTSVTDTSVTFSFDNTANDSRTFELRPYAPGTFTGNVSIGALGYKFVAAGSTTVTMDNLQANTTYDFVFRALCNPGTSPTTVVTASTSGGGAATTIAKIDINTASSATKQGYTALTGTTNSTATIADVNYQLFGFNSQPGTTTNSDDLLSDFAVNSSTNPNVTPAIGFRITGLSAGTYTINSWHYDAAVATSSIKVEIREAGFGNPITTLKTGVSLGSTAATSYQITIEPNKNYDLIFRAESGETQSRFNGIEITSSSALASVANKSNFEDTIAVYPNPFKAYFNIKLPKHKKYTKMVLFDLMGRTILNQEIQENEQNPRINASLVQGTYILKLFEKSGKFITKTVMKN